MKPHTPGPWHVVPFVDAIHISASDGSLIAEIADRNIQSEGMPPENAALIAAAPDLLNAVRNLLRCTILTEGSVEVAEAREVLSRATRA